jgi:purine-cytosine permease-like protein
MKFPLKKVLLFLISGLLVFASGFAVRYGEDNQVGSSNKVSMWVFVIGILLVYYAAVVTVSYFLKRNRARGNRE